MTVRGLASILVFPATFLATHAIALVAIGRGAPAFAVVVPLVLASIALVAFLERVMPFEPDWNRARADVGTDVLHNLISTLGTSQAIETALLALLAPAAGALASVAGVALWPIGWSLVSQTALAFALAELGGYWAHRAGHQTGPGWRLHAVHHSPTRLYWLNAGRDHPLGVLLLHAPSILPLVVLGAPPEMFAMLGLLNAVVGLFQHANVDIRLGPLNYLFSVLEVHRWHHSTVVAEANNNYGSNLMIWDLVFGSFYLPRERRTPDAIGIAGMPTFPTGFLGQLTVPFRWQRFTRA